MTDQATTQSPFLRDLASSDPSLRTSALDNLRTYLSAHAAFQSLELLKLWKGLYYSMWMCDKPLAQQRLAAEFADLINTVRPENVLPFLEAFWLTIAREWTGIEALRMDKYLRLVRFVLRASFVWLSRNKWADGKARRKYLTILEETPLCAKDIRVPNGLRYHVLDIYVDELEVVMPEEEDQWKDMPLEEMLGPVKKLAKNSPTKPVRKRAHETLEDEKVMAWLGKEPRKDSAQSNDEPAEVNDEDDGDFGGFED